MSDKDVRFSRPRSISAMVREDFEDFITALKAEYPATVFFSSDDKRQGDYRTYPDPFAWYDAKPKRMSSPVMFRVPSTEDLRDGRPEILSGGINGPLSRFNKEDFLKAGRWGNIHFIDLKHFDQAIIPALDSEDYREAKACREQIEHIRVFDCPTFPRTEISFCYDRGDPKIAAWVKQVRDIWNSLIVRTFAVNDLLSGEVVRTVTLDGIGPSKRIMDACAMADDLYVSISYDSRQARYFAKGPTESYRKKARNRST